MGNSNKNFGERHVCIQLTGAFIRIGDTPIEATPIAALFQMDVEEFGHAIHNRWIESAEIGSDPEILHLIFRSSERQVRVVAEQDGTIHSCRAEPLRILNARRISISFWTRRCFETFPASDPIAITSD